MEPMSPTLHTPIVTKINSRKVVHWQSPEGHFSKSDTELEDHKVYKEMPQPSEDNFNLIEKHLTINNPWGFK